MKYEARKFSKQSYDDNDSFAKKKVIDHLVCSGHEILSSEEDYNHDIITTKDGKKFLFEVEVKRNYPFTGAKDYKFNSVSFLGRKERLHKIKPFYYIIVCYETDYAVFCESSGIFKDEYKEQLNLSNYDRKGQDEMFRVPIDNCTFFKLKTSK